MGISGHWKNGQILEAKEDPVAKLKQLKEMLDAGLISQDEYDKAKVALLAKM